MRPRSLLYGAQIVDKPWGQPDIGLWSHLQEAALDVQR
jgi:hypothetical protein